MNFEITKADLGEVRVDRAPGPELADGDARVRVERFGLSSNNITYAVLGEMLRYWEFFPVPGDDVATWFRLPVWGFGSVVESRSNDIEVDERLFGYFPMGSELVITPGRADDRNVTDMAPHRREMASAYSRYARVATDPLHRDGREDQHMLLYPLFFTSFLIDDVLTDDDSFATEQIVLSSASSKTAIGVAHLGRQRGAHMVGLTSPANAAFVEGLGCYDEVHLYDAVDQLAPVSSVYLDIAGDREVVRTVHARLGDAVAHSLIVGGTHWEARADSGEPLPGPAPELFFAPTQIAKRTKEWGGDELDRRLGTAWDAFTGWTDGWLELRHAEGAEPVLAVYRELLGGRVDPRVGLTCSLRDE